MRLLEAGFTAQIDSGSQSTSLRDHEAMHQLCWHWCGCDLVAPPLTFSGDAIPSQENEYVPKTALESTARLAFLDLRQP